MCYQHNQWQVVGEGEGYGGHHVGWFILHQLHVTRWTGCLYQDDRELFFFRNTFHFKTMRFERKENNFLARNFIHYCEFPMC